MAQETSPASGAASTPSTNSAAATAPAEKAISKFKQRQLEKGRDSFIVEGPQELVDMMRAAAKAKDDMSLVSWTRFAVADAVNAANLTHEVTYKPNELGEGHPGGTRVEPWAFDVSELEGSKAKRSTKGLSEEEKKAQKEKKAAEDKAEREQIKNILKRHKELVMKGRSPAAATEEVARELAAKSTTD